MHTERTRDTAALLRVLQRASGWLWSLLLALAAAAGLEASPSSTRWSSSRPLVQLEYAGPRALSLVQERHRPPGAGLARRHQTWRPHLHRTTAPWMQTGPRSRQLRFPAEANVDPFAERWQFDGAPVAAVPHYSDLPSLLLQLVSSPETPRRAPYLVRSFPRPPPADL